jgi:type 1 glutamine amidotransferase
MRMNRTTSFHCYWSISVALCVACGTENPPSAPSAGGASGAGGSITSGGGGSSGSGGATSPGGTSSSGGAGAGGTSTVGGGGSGGAAGSAGSGGETQVPTALDVLAIGELMVDDGPEIHAPFVEAAKTWLATEPNLTVTHIESPDTLTDELLANYDVILQLNYTPFRWNTTARAAFEKYMTEGNGGWVGLHHAGLYGPVVTPDSEEPWTWFYDFLGQINYQNYIASFAEATVHVEDAAHPVLLGVPATFQVTTDEWYVWDESPRPNVHVLANVDEASYQPPSEVTMGDHPVIWTNEDYAGKNLYIFIGHHPNLFENAAYVTLLRNAIWWAGTPKP